MEVTDTSEQLCFCGGKLRMEFVSPVKFSAPYAPKDELWFCPLCGKYFIKIWRADDIDYYTEKADYTAVFEELKPSLRFCYTCKGPRKNYHPVYLGRPVCPNCFLMNEWEDRYKRREVEKKFPSDIEIRDFMAAERALENWSYAEAFESFKPFAEAGMSLAQFRMGEMYESGPIETRDLLQALEWYKKAAQRRFALAFSRIGKLYSESPVIGVNRIEAYKWLNVGAYFGDFASIPLRSALTEKLSLEDIVRAQDESGVMLRKLWGDFDKRKRIFDSLNGAHGELEGTFRYAEILDGRSLKTFLLNYNESEKYYRSLSEDRYTPAMARLGEKLATGTGIVKNPEEATHWLITAISRDWLPAVEFAWNQVSAGCELKIEQEWIKKRFFDEIEDENSHAMHVWAMINFRGNGVPVDLKEAHKWLNLAQYFGAKLPRPNYMEMIEREINFNILFETLCSTQKWLEDHKKISKKVAKNINNLKDRVKTEGEGKWYNLGELFLYGREDYLRHIILAYGCYDLALKAGNQAATTHLEYLARILTSAKTAEAVDLTAAFVKSGQIPV